MPTEERKITFSNIELIDALTLLCRAAKEDFPFHRQANICMTGTVNLEVTVTDPNGGDSTRVFSNSEVAVALMMLCRKDKIPLPRRAEKSLEKADSGITLVVKLTD